MTQSDVICEAGEAGQGFAIEKQFTNEEKSWIPVKTITLRPIIQATVGKNEKNHLPSTISQRAADNIPNTMVQLGQTKSSKGRGGKKLPK